MRRRGPALETFNQAVAPRRGKREEQQLIPDGIFSAVMWTKAQATVALELELHAKTTQRYDKIFSKYLEKKNLGFIWYFVKSKAFASSLIAKWRHVEGRRYRPPGTHGSLLVTVLSDFEANPRDARVYFASAKSWSVEEVFRLTEPAQRVGRQIEQKAESEPEQIAS